jgi:ribosome recycling factor
MAAKQRLDQLKQQIDRLRRDSLDVVANANKIVSGGVQKLADRELKALNDYYHSAIDSIRSANKGDLRGLAHQQLDLLQDTVNQVISHARESLGIVAETRAELAKLVQKGIRGEKVALADLEKAAAPARKAVSKVKASATEAGRSAQKAVKKAGDKAKSRTTKALSSGKRSAVAAVKAVEQALPLPSPDSRASRATSRAKKAASGAVGTVSDAVSTLSSAVSDAVGKIGDAVKTKH